RDVIGDPVAVAKDHRDASFTDALRENPIDPDVHERRRPEHYVWHATPADGILDIPLDSEDVDGGILCDAPERDEDQTAHACVARRRTEILVSREVDARWAGGALAHVVVRRGDDLLDAAACLGELRHIPEVDGCGFRRGRELGECVLVAGERANSGAGRNKLARDDAAKLTRSADDRSEEHTSELQSH